MDAASSAEVAALFTEFDRGAMPELMGTRRRQLFHYRGLYFHLQDFDGQEGPERIEAARTRPEFARISEELKPFITAYDPATWRSPKDAMAERFYDWAAERDR
ncbi:TcmI family type II polyketide cyclase [Amycolatopsis sp. 195334CR]|nr:TcmI family type II polyketide cyclase [Amycolatopsis sp. 195334CR]